MTDEEKSFWDYIRANPNDNTVLLVFADWLEEHGRAPQAKVLRLLAKGKALAREAMAEIAERRRGK